MMSPWCKITVTSCKLIEHSRNYQDVHHHAATVYTVNVVLFLRTGSLVRIKLDDIMIFACLAKKGDHLYTKVNTVKYTYYLPGARHGVDCD